MKLILFYIWKFFYLRSDRGSVELGGVGEHPTVGIYAMLCSMEQGIGGRGEH